MGSASISVIVPAYNGARFLSTALRSIREQEMPGMEVILVDDGSTDDPEFIAKEHANEIRYVRQEHSGQSSARNRGIRESSGEFIAFLDIDDLWMPRQLHHLMQVLQGQPDAGIAQGLMRQVVENSGGVLFETAPYRMPYLGTCLFRRWVFDLCGLFDETMAFGEDYDLLFRCWEQDVLKVHVDAVSLLYRRHSRNLTIGRNNHAHLLVLKRRIERIKGGFIDPAAPRRAPFQAYIGDLRTLEARKGLGGTWIN
jgi:glycosyltransferase involved in cell wall biosynthesis